MLPRVTGSIKQVFREIKNFRPGVLGRQPAVGRTEKRWHTLGRRSL